MYIESIKLRNFRGYEDNTFLLKPGINLLIGPNASGKTTMLEALSVALGSFFLGIRGYDSRHIRVEDIRIKANRHGDSLSFERQYPVVVAAVGEVFGKTIEWSRSLAGPDSRTSSKEAHSIKALAEQADADIRVGAHRELPLIAYYGNGRLWLEPRDMGKTVNPDEKGDLSRFMGYYLAIDPRCSPKELMKWLKRQEWISYKQKRQPTGLMVVKRALVGCIEEASDIAFDPEREELVLFFKEGPELPFGMLSDGQRGIAALVGDLAMRASRLNPQFGESVLEETPGVVLIDEVDLYLHPKWQRTILGNLSYVFPKIQFVCTTHSPQVVGGIGPECIINLDTGAKSAGQSLGLDSNSVLRQIMGATERDTETLKLLERVYSKLEEDDLEGATAALDVVRARLRGPDSETVRLETTIHNLETLKED